MLPGEFDTQRSSRDPSDPPSHTERVASARAEGALHQTVAAADHWTGMTAE